MNLLDLSPRFILKALGSRQNYYITSVFLKDNAIRTNVQEGGLLHIISKIQTVEPMKLRNST